jgi:nucleoside-diphosphate-sugar epimerase
MEVWLSPERGFDYPNGTARIFGSGRNQIDWVSSRDVAEMCALALRHPAARQRVIEFGGPEPLSPLEVVARFEKAVAGSSRWSMSPNQHCANNLVLVTIAVVFSVTLG